MMRRGWPAFVTMLGIAALGLAAAHAQDAPPTSYAPVVVKESFADTMARMSAAKPAIMKRQMALLEERYDLSDRAVRGITMSGGKAVQEGVRVKLPRGVTWQQLAEMTPAEVKPSPKRKSIPTLQIMRSPRRPKKRERESK